MGEGGFNTTSVTIATRGLRLGKGAVRLHIRGGKHNAADLTRLAG